MKSIYSYLHGELAGFVQTGAQQTRDLPDDSLRGEEGIILISCYEKRKLEEEKQRNRKVDGDKNQSKNAQQK